MLPVASKSTKEINKFIFVPIPTPRDLFMRYGARSGGSGAYLNDVNTLNKVSSGNSTIQQMINAQRIAENDLSKV